VAVVVDVVGGELGDGGDALGVEQEQQPGDPVRGGEGGVVEEPAGVGPAFLGVVRTGWAVPADRAEGQAAGVPVGEGPADEVGGLVAVAVPSGRPVVEVGLGAVGKGPSSRTLLRVNKIVIMPPRYETPEYEGRWKLRI
jgi:hypothetical protein